jgi:hypothetical protein
MSETRSTRSTDENKHYVLLPLLLLLCAAVYVVGSSHYCVQ